MPYKIASVKCENRTGFIGRAVAMNVGGIECVLMARNDADLANVGRAMFNGEYNPERIYRATMIQSVGIDVVQPEVQVPVQPVVPEVPVAPAKPGKSPVRSDDGVPVVKYKNDKPDVADHVVGEDHGAFEVPVDGVVANPLPPDDDEL